jgi:hypothetical protein
MAGAVQQFQINEPVPGLPGEYVCAGCQAPMVMTEPVGDSPTGTLEMTHTERCGEVSNLTRVQR